MGLGLFTSVLIGGGAAALYLTGTLDKLLGSLSNLSTTGNILPNDFEQAFKEYEEAMEAYNAEIKKYEGTFDDSFKSIANKGTSAFNLLQEKSAKAAKKASDSWLASFDEVYKVPEDNSLVDDEFTFPDLAALIDKLGFLFPATIEAELVMPTFKWSDVYEIGRAHV